MAEREFDDKGDVVADMAQADPGGMPGARATIGSEGRLAGLLFILSPLLSLPSSLLIEPRPDASSYLLTVLAVVTGVVCLRAPWERMSRWWLHVAGAVATVEVTAAVVISDPVYAFFYVFVALFAAYIARSRKELALQLGLIAIGLVAPAAIEPDTARETFKLALIALPTLAIASFVVMNQREQLEADRRTYRGFAEEALALAGRIRKPPEG